MKMKTKYLAFALLPALVAWPQPPTRAAPRCYPTERFKVLDDQFVRDTLTKLVWQRQASTTTMTWATAKTYCSNSGFRLPTVKELLSIVDLTVRTVDSPGPIIDQAAFPNTPSEAFWTSSPSARISSDAWNVNFSDGWAGTFRMGNDYRVRCIR
jgi:hypothetical protein